MTDEQIRNKARDIVDDNVGDGAEKYPHLCDAISAALKEAGEAKSSVDIGCSCGRKFLSVNGVILAMEGDPCRDGDVSIEARKELFQQPLIEREDHRLWGDATLNAAKRLIERPFPAPYAPGGES